MLQSQTKGSKTKNRLLRYFTVFDALNLTGFEIDGTISSLRHLRQNTLKRC